MRRSLYFALALIALSTSATAIAAPASGGETIPLGHHVTYRGHVSKISEAGFPRRAAALRLEETITVVDDAGSLVLHTDRLWISGSDSFSLEVRGVNYDHEVVLTGRVLVETYCDSRGECEVYPRLFSPDPA